MPRYAFNCDCGESFTKIVPVGTETSKCGSCGSAAVKVIKASESMLIDVEDGYEYRDGQKAWRKNVSDTDYASILLGEKDPY